MPGFIGDETGRLPAAESFEARTNASRFAGLDDFGRTPVEEASVPKVEPDEGRGRDARKCLCHRDQRVGPNAGVIAQL
jgi:hypothetical protein